MSDKWRPEGWKQPHRFVRIPSLLELSVAQDTDEVKFYQNESYELGADAMLESIWNMARKSTTGAFTFDAKTISIFRDGAGL